MLFSTFIQFYSFQIIDYYPFGLQYVAEPTTSIAGSPKNNYLYNGKELQDKLKAYDFGFRFYDPVIGRWGRVDPLAENHYDHAPYNYVLGNPVKYADFMGLDTITVQNHTQTPKAGDDIQGDDGSLTRTPMDAAVVNAGRGPSAGMDIGPDIEPASGFWEHVGAYTFGRNRDGFSYDVDGRSTGRTPLMGLPPDFGIGKPTALLNLAKNIRSLFAAKEVGKGAHLLYEGLDAAGNVKYIGITGRDAAVRFGEHLNSGTARSLLDYRVIEGATGLSKTQARIWEQTLINHYGLERDGGQLLNKVNSISPKYWGQYGIK
ncbi:RHS repeat-associated core domain-containing protein [Olivibacter sp. SA151]|uniref:RHS repeat-associated core domain-containing protein n=1 Tax=Olivibacter jilunii TaxID=985016 RepID=UPI003F176BFD